MKRKYTHFTVGDDYFVESCGFESCGIDGYHNADNAGACHGNLIEVYDKRLRDALAVILGRKETVDELNEIMEGFERNEPERYERKVE